MSVPKCTKVALLTVVWRIVHVLYTSISVPKVLFFKLFGFCLIVHFVFYTLFILCVYGGFCCSFCFSSFSMSVKLYAFSLEVTVVMLSKCVALRTWLHWSCLYLCWKCAFVVKFYLNHRRWVKLMIWFKLIACGLLSPLLTITFYLLPFRESIVFGRKQLWSENQPETNYWPKPCNMKSSHDVDCKRLWFDIWRFDNSVQPADSNGAINHAPLLAGRNKCLNKILSGVC